LKERIPVVLPCGHTYICKICANRIKICHQCREPLYWNPPRPPQQPNNHIHRSPAANRYSRYNNQHAHHNRYLHSPSTPPHPAIAPVAKQEEVPLPCPKNVVLMEMIEAKQRQERLVAEQKAIKEQKRNEKLQERERKRQERREEKRRLRLLHKPDSIPDSSRSQTTGTQHSHRGSDNQEIEVDIDQNQNDYFISNINSNGNVNGGEHYQEEDEDEDRDYDDEISSSSSSTLPLGDPQLNSGYAALSGTCGTYAVREPEGLVVLPHDPTRPKYQNSATQQQEQLQQLLSDEKKDPETFQDISRQFSSLFVNKEIDTTIDEGGDGTPSRWSKEPFSIEEGQKVQVVGVLESNEQGVYQLARGVGYVVATTKQLVKVGGPMETSCKLEGMLQSVLGMQQETQRKLNEIKNLSMLLRKEVILEQDKPEEVPVITPSIHKKNVSVGTDGEDAGSAADDGAYPMTPTKGFTQAHGHHSPMAGWNGGLVSVASADSTAVELGGTDPRTPHHQSNIANPYAEKHPLASAYNRQQTQYTNSPARSCPTPSNHGTASHLDQPFLDDESYGFGVLRYRVNNDDEMSGMGWAGLMGCGSSLFGERLVQSSQRGETNAAGSIFNSATNGNREFLGLSLDENSLIQNSNVQRRAAALAQAAGGSAIRRTIESSGSADSPLRRGGSFDGGVNFRGGYSNHGGLGRTRRGVFDQQSTNQRNSSFGNSHHLHNHNYPYTPESQEPRRQLVMSQMSQHRGVGVASVQRRHPNGDLIQTISR